MRLYVVRHAEAVPIGGSIQRDADRTLSPAGEQDAELVGRMLGDMDSHIERVTCSPLIRARQTAEILSSAMTKHPVIHVTEHLAPGFSHRKLLEELMALGADGSIAAVGHQPDLSMFISTLIANGADAAIALEPGAVAHVQVENTRAGLRASLRWLLTPANIRRVLPHP